MIAPPDIAIAEALYAAARSKCIKSKRGVAAFTFVEDGKRLRVLGAGNNGPPGNFGCDGSEACRADCAKRSVHAESRALRIADHFSFNKADVQLVHVKWVHGVLVAGGGPSCWQCSREILDVGIGGIWLYEAGASKCLACHRFEDSSARLEDRVRRCMECSNEHLTRIDSWRYYTAEDFHHTTLATCGIGGPL